MAKLFSPCSSSQICTSSPEMSQPSSVRRPMFRSGLTAHQDVPVLQHLLGGVLLEVDQLKQLDLITLRGEDQLVLLAVEAHLEGDFVKDLVQSLLPFGPRVPAPRVWSLSSSIIWRNAASISAKVSHQFSVRSRKHSENCGREMPFLHQSISSAVVSSSSRASFQCLFKISQSAALLIQIIIGIAHAEVPVVGLPRSIPHGASSSEGPMSCFLAPPARLESARLL